MITFDEGSLRFVYRVAGVAIEDGRVLLQKLAGQDLWFLPGGRGELLEASRETLKREMLEELSSRVKVNRLLWVVENFYSGNDLVSGKGKTYHELVLYFLMDFPQNSRLRKLDSFPVEDGGFEFTFRWHRLAELKKVNVRPSFLQTALQRIPESTQHIVHREE